MKTMGTKWLGTHPVPVCVFLIGGLVLVDMTVIVGFSGSTSPVYVFETVCNIFTCCGIVHLTFHQ